MTVVAQLGIGARAKMQMAATGDRGFRLAGHFMHHRYGPFNAPLTINPPGRR